MVVLPRNCKESSRSLSHLRDEFLVPFLRALLFKMSRDLDVAPPLA